MKSKLTLLKSRPFAFLFAGIVFCSLVSAWAETEARWIPAADKEQVKRIGEWRETSFRYAAKPHLLATNNARRWSFSLMGRLSQSGWETKQFPLMARRIVAHLSQPSTVSKNVAYTRLQAPVKSSSHAGWAKNPIYCESNIKVWVNIPAAGSKRFVVCIEKPAAYYYDREVIAKLPADMPPGIYDLNGHVIDDHPSGRRTGICRSARSVHVVSEFPTDPVLVTFGHLDTAGQYQAEYLQRLATMTNLLAPNLVLDSTAVNPAYISGALSKLDVPYVVNFGNHQFYGHEQWYGDPVGMVNFGPDFSVVNFGHPWHEDRSKADALLSSRPDCRYKIINAFEANAPTEWLDKHQVCMIHDAHGTGVKNTDFGTTPTRRVSKVK